MKIYFLQTRPDFDPETHCPYTGLRLWPFPCPEAGLMFYYREPNAYLRRCRELTAEEISWIRDNPEAFSKERLRFEAWRDRCRT